ncbi:MAG: hypothetical protein ACR2JC_17140 [Chloroflexota bacterium]
MTVRWNCAGSGCSGPVLGTAGTDATGGFSNFSATVPKASDGAYPIFGRGSTTGATAVTSFSIKG